MAKLLEILADLRHQSRHLFASGRVVLRHMIHLLESRINAIGRRRKLALRSSDLLHEGNVFPHAISHPLRGFKRRLRTRRGRMRLLYDTLGCRPTRVCQLTHFCSHHGKTPAIHSGPGRLHSCIESQDVSLLRKTGYLRHARLDAQSRGERILRLRLVLRHHRN